MIRRSIVPLASLAWSFGIVALVVSPHARDPSATSNPNLAIVHAGRYGDQYPPER